MPYIQNPPNLTTSTPPQCHTPTPPPPPSWRTEAWDCCLSWRRCLWAGWLGSEEARQLGRGGSSSEGLEQPSVGPPLHQGTGARSPPSPPGAWGLGLLVPLAEGQLAAGLDPGEASHRRLLVAVAALPPHSSTGHRCRSGGAGVEVAVLYRGWWLQCGFGQPFRVPSWSEEPHIGRQCGRVDPSTHHLSGFSWGPPTQDTGRCCSRCIYWRWQVVFATDGQMKLL